VARCGGYCLQDEQVEEGLFAWENEGGSSKQAEKQRMTGTVNQIAWAEQIKAQVNEEFDRVRRALATVAIAPFNPDRSDIVALIDILEDKRADVLAHEDAGYFIHGWQETRDQVRKLILADSRYKAIREAGPKRNLRAAVPGEPVQ